MRIHRFGTAVRRGSLMIACAALLAGGVARAQAKKDEVKEVEATGEAAITGGDRGHARERAIEDAQRKAVEQAVGTLVVASSESKDFQLVNDRILTHARGYVKGYDVLEEKESGSGDTKAISVKIRAKVGTEALSSDLAAIGLMLNWMGFPRMAVLISEQHVGQTSPAAWWGPGGGGQQAGGVISVSQRLVENSLIDDWKKVGFDFVDMEALSGKLKIAAPVTVNPTGEQAKEIANLADADVIILGTAIATKQGDLGQLFNDKSGDIQMLSCQGTVSARVFNSDSGEILATGQATKVAAHIDTVTCDKNAMLAAAKTFGADLQAKILAEWAKKQGGGARVRLHVKGIDSYGTLTAFKALLSGRGIQAVDQKSFKDGVADLDLRIKGKAEDIAGDMDGKAMGKVKVHVVGVTRNTIQFEIR